MTSIDLLVSGPHVLTMVGDGVGYRSDVGIGIDRGRIVTLGPRQDVHAQYSADRTMPAPYKVGVSANPRE